MQLRRPTTNQSQQRSTGDTILTWLWASVISSPFLLTRSRFVQPSFCRDPFPIGTKEWKYPVDWLGPGSWVMTECPPDYLGDLCSYSRDHLWSLDISPSLRDCHWHSSHPGMNDLSDEELVMTMTDLDFSLVLSRVCQISFGNLSHSDQHQLSHETQIFMSDEWSLGLTRDGNDETFLSSHPLGCAVFPTVCKTPGSGQTPGHLFPDPGNYTTLLPRPVPGQSGHISLDIFISESDQVQFSSSPVINVTPHPYFSFQGRRRLFTLLNCLRIPILALR